MEGGSYHHSSQDGHPAAPGMMGHGYGQHEYPGGHEMDGKTLFLNIVSNEIYDIIWILIKQKTKCEFLLTSIQFKAIISYFHIRYICQTDFGFFNKEISSDISSSNFC